MTAVELAAQLRNLDEAATDAWKQHGERPTSANRKLFITAIADRDVALRNNLPVIVAFLERLAEAEAHMATCPMLAKAVEHYYEDGGDL